MEQHTHRKEFVRGMKNGIPIAMGHLAVAFTLGIAAKKAGITAFQAGLTSFGLHASAGEYICFTLIAAHALSKDLILVTNNTREFCRVDGLKLEDWTIA